jgi:hypothetical protein
LVSDDGGLEVPSKMIEDCVAALERRSLVEELEQIDRELPLAEESDKDRLVRRKQLLTQKIRALGGRRWKSFRQTRS